MAGRAQHVALPVNLVPRLLALPVLAASAILPWQSGWVLCIATIVALGVPHGALDVEIGRSLFRPRWGRVWFPVFALPYLSLVALVLVSWRIAPDVTLAGFLLASVWHFGCEDADGLGLPALARGGLPIALPVLLHPAATARFLSAVTGLAFATPPVWLTAASMFWLVPATMWIVQEATAQRVRSLAVPGAIACAFVALPPLTAFALYFVVVHAPAHTLALIRHGTRIPRAATIAQAWALAALPTILTILIGAALWPFYSGALPVRLVCVTLQMLAALTLPHMLLDAWLNRRERTMANASAIYPHAEALCPLP
jgi:Brp/Blh family beta-carotene 15,15'-monooxygenase